MATKDIRTAQAHVSCDVCGRTLLRGEHAQTYLAGGARRAVCELCAPRAVHEGWVREGVALERGTRAVPGERRRSLVSRLRRRVSAEPEREPEQVAPGRSAAVPAANGWREAELPEPLPGRQRAVAAASGPPREPRQIRAVPTSEEQRIATAIERFNLSEHPRTVAGVARSLGAPVVVVRPVEAPGGGLVTVVVSWELCWYRYEVQLSDDGAGVRAAGQGYDLAELPVEDCAEANASADEHGRLALP